MKKIRLGIYIEDSEYGDRLTCYFMNHYKDQLEIHMYTMKEQLEHLEGEIDIMLSSELDQWNNKYIPLIQIVEETPIESEEGIYFVEKYQEVNRIVEEILKHVGGEVRDLKSEGSLIGQTRLISVYSLADNQYQMPFAMTLSSILSENEKVLLMDFQENSGLSRMLEQSVEHNLDELLVMAESGRYSTNRINSCIGRKHKLDYVYPIENTECLCEINTVICNNLLQMLGKEMHYDCIVLNMGTRFKGFFDILDRCSDIYLVQKKGGISQWREYEFTEELIERGLSNVVERIKLIEPPVITTPVNPISIGGSAVSIRKFPEHPMSMERLVEIEALSPEVARLLQILTQAKYNIFISGGTGSGKTTFLNALSQYIPDDERIITIEDSAELQLLGAKNIVRLETRNANTDGVTPITIRDLIRTALRMRPDRIIVGECRGAEALDMLQAIICTI